MRNLHFKYAKAENFICFGKQPIEINFENYGNIVLIRGQICDLKADEDEDEDVRKASNGVGKSSIPEILTYTLYGKTIKKPKSISHKDVINNKSAGKLRTEVIWDNFRVVRTRTGDNKGTLQLWESAEGVWNDDTELTQGGMPATQKLIEEKIGLSYEAFVNIVVFTDDSNASFLECNTADKRKIVENLLSLEKYQEYLENGKRLLKESKEKVKLLAKEYELLLHDKDTCQKRIVQIEQQEKSWKEDRANEVKKLAAEAKAKQTLLAETDEGAALLAYNDAQEKIKELNESIASYEAKLVHCEQKILKPARETISKLRDRRDDLNLEIQTHTLNIKRLQDDIAACDRSIAENEGKDGTCPWCNGQVEKKNLRHLIEHANEAKEEARKSISEIKLEMEAYKEKKAKVESEIDRIEGIVETTETKQQQIQSKLRENRNQLHGYSKVREPKANSAQLLLEQQITDLKKLRMAKMAELEGPSPFVSILASAKQDADNRATACADKKEQIQKEESTLPYYDYWLRAFGDNGIRKFVIDGIVPALNARIAYWLQFLIDNKINLKFNSQLDETIHRNPEDGNPFVYFMLSKGQRQRLNLSVSQAFAYVMMLNLGTSPSVVFLDEVTTNIDPVGVQGIYNMICELAKDKQVFVTTHDQDLLALLHGCQTINLEMRNGITKMV